MYEHAIYEHKKQNKNKLKIKKDKNSKTTPLDLPTISGLLPGKESATIPLSDINVVIAWGSLILVYAPRNC